MFMSTSNRWKKAGQPEKKRRDEWRYRLNVPERVCRKLGTAGIPGQSEPRKLLALFPDGYNEKMNMLG